MFLKRKRKQCYSVRSWKGSTEYSYVHHPGLIYTVQHAQQCSRGGFINERHDSLRDFLTVLLDKVYNSVKAEPHLTNLSGEELAYNTAIKGDDARADIKARGFWRRGVDAYFDVSFANVNAQSYKVLAPNEDQFSVSENSPSVCQRLKDTVV